MRFYIPGTVSSKKEVNGEDGSGADEEEQEEEEQNAANLFYETLIDKAEIGEVAGATFATFQDILHLTPRGRFDIDMYENSFRLRGKTYDYKIQYQSIKKFFILPKNDEMHTLITLGLDPPLRQGQTRYPFIVMQLKLDDEVNLDLNMTEEDLQTKYKDKLDSHYEAPIHHVIAKVFKGLSGKKIIMPSKDFVSHHNMNGVKCSIKANEGLLFCLDKSFMFVPKPATYIQIESIASITMSRVGGALAASRTFDITMTLKGGQGEHQFSNINREEQQPLEAFFQVSQSKRFLIILTDCVRRPKVSASRTRCWTTHQTCSRLPWRNSLPHRTTMTTLASIVVQQTKTMNRRMRISRLIPTVMLLRSSIPIMRAVVAMLEVMQRWLMLMTMMAPTVSARLKRSGQRRRPRSSLDCLVFMLPQMLPEGDM